MRLFGIISSAALLGQTEGMGYHPSCFQAALNAYCKDVAHTLDSACTDFHFARDGAGGWGCFKNTNGPITQDCISKDGNKESCGRGRDGNCQSPNQALKDIIAAGPIAAGCPIPKYSECSFKSHCDLKADCIKCRHDDCGGKKEICECIPGYAGTGKKGDCKKQDPCPVDTPYAFQNGDQCCAVGKDDTGEDLKITSEKCEKDAATAACGTDKKCKNSKAVPEGTLYKSEAGSVIVPSQGGLLKAIPKLFNYFELIFYVEPNEKCEKSGGCSILNFGGGVSYGEVFMYEQFSNKIGFKYKTTSGLKPDNFAADGAGNYVLNYAVYNYEVMRIGDEFTAPHSYSLPVRTYTKVNITMYTNADGEHWFEINYNDKAKNDGLKIGPLPIVPSVLVEDTHLYAAKPGASLGNVNVKNITFKTHNCPVGEGYFEDENEVGSCQVPNLSKCKNDDCWDWDKDAKTCTMKVECMKVTCGAESMDVQVKSALFGLQTEDTAKVTPEPEANANDVNGFNFQKSCKLGACGMTYKIVGTNLEFTMILRETDEDGFTDTIDNATDALTVNSNPFAIAVKFTCTYPVAVKLSSEPFNLKDVVLGAGPSGTGSLSNGFTLNLDAGVDAPIKLGDRQKVTASWAVTTLEKVTFNFTDCTVAQGETKVALVKNKCYSEALKVTRNDGTATEQSFSYQTFSAVGATTTTQTMTCGINICMDDCGLPGKDDECLKTGEDGFSSYKFKVAGWIDENDRT